MAGRKNKMDQFCDIDSDLQVRLDALKVAMQNGRSFNRQQSARTAHKIHSSGLPISSLLRYPDEQTVHRGCPVEREANVSLPHQAQVRSFNARSAPRDNLVLEELKRTFNIETPRRPGDWLTGFYFLKVHGIKAANSCAARLRQHHWIIENQLDIDSSQIPAEQRFASLNRSEWWRYRLCHKLDSERLKREMKK